MWDGSAWRGAGAFSLNIDPDTLATKTDLTNYLPLTGGTLSGYLKIKGNKVLDTADKSIANGVASLDANAKIPTEQIPVATTSTVGGVKPDGNTITVTENGTISAVGGSGSGSGFDFEGTKAEFDAAVAAGTITEDSVSLITDDVSGDNVATKEELQAVDRSKADTSLSNVLANIDYVIESKTPTTDDPTWYRKYKSGWLEQGGVVTAAGEVTLLKPFANTAYSVQATCLYTNYTNWGVGVNKTSVSSFYLNMNTGTQGAMWEAKGQGAE